MPKLIDLTGKRFGRLTVVAWERNDGTHTYWKCICDCGKEIITRSGNLRRGATNSCGCLKKDRVREVLVKRNTSHGQTKTRLYRIWAKIHERCSNPNSKRYADYGGRGIRVCEEWKDFAVFQKWALENGYRDDLTIDRIDNNGSYTPQNCRWVDYKTQNRNRRDNNLVTYKGQTKTLTEWAEQFQIRRTTLANRLKLGWSVEEAISTPVRKFNKK